MFISLLPFAAFANDEMSHPLPDDSYIHAKLSSSYAQCIKQSGAVTFEMQSCMHQEYAQHKNRVEQVLCQNHQSSRQCEKRPPDG